MSPRPESRHPDLLENGGEQRTVTTLASGDDDRQGLAALLARQMGFRGPPATRAPQRVVGGFGFDPARRPVLLVAVAAGASRVLVGPGDGRVDTDVPHDRARRAGECLQSGEDPHPHPGANGGTARRSSATPAPGGRPATGIPCGSATGFRR